MASTTSTPSGQVARPPLNLTGKRNRHFTEELVRYLLIACALVTVLTTVGIVLILVVEATSFFRDVSILDFLFGTKWNIQPFNPEFNEFGVLPLVAGTVLTSVVAAIIALPLGLAAAIYLSEFAGERARSILKPILEILAGVPTVVYGYFALTFITPVILQKILPGTSSFNGLSAGIAIGIMTLPTVASLSEDAIRAVPRSLREAAYGLGATRFETIIRVVVPAAVSGIIASFILAISRAVGETMIVALASGATPAGIRGHWWDVTQDMQTMTGFIAITFSSDVSRQSVEFYSLFGVGLLLFVMTLAMNLLSQWVTNRFREEYD